MSKEKKRKYDKDAIKNRTKKSHETRDDYGISGENYLNVSSEEDLKFYKVKKTEDGRNLIDIVPYVTGSKHPTLKKGDIDYILDIWVHRNLGVKRDKVLCMENTYGKPCAACDKITSLKDSGDFDEDVVKALYPKRRAIYNVVDLKDKDSAIKIWDGAHPHTEKEIVQEAFLDDEEVILYADIDEGKSIKFRGEHNEKFKYIKPVNFSFVDRDKPYTEDVIDEAYSLDEFLVIPDYFELAALVEGIEDDEDDEILEDTSEDSPKEAPTPDDEKAAEEDEPKRERKRDKKEKKSGPVCPDKKGVFGRDCDKLDACDDCEDKLWKECAKKSEENLDKDED